MYNFDTLFHLVTKELRLLSDLNTQQKVWKEGKNLEESPKSSFEEVTSEFIDAYSDLIDDLEERYHEYGLSYDETQALVQVYQNVYDYAYNGYPPETDEEVLKDPEWMDIVKAAKSIYNVLRKNTVLFKHIPSSWNIYSKAYIGTIFECPSNPFVKVRVMDGNSESAFSILQNTYVRHHTSGGYLSKDGDIVSSTDIKGFIPWAEYDFDALSKNTFFKRANREALFKQFLNESLVKFCDLEYQKKVWVEQQGIGIDSIEESLCSFFDDFKGVTNSKKTYPEVYALKQKIRNYLANHYMQPKQLLRDPKWKEIIIFSKDILERQK